jgi:hypothetical protein
MRWYNYKVKNYRLGTGQVFIPLEGENILCLCNTVAIYKTDAGTEILKVDGSVIRTGFTPTTLKKRQLDFLNKQTIVINGRSSSING